MGVALLLPTFPPSDHENGHYHKTEPRDRTDYNPAFYFEGFMVYQLSDARNYIYI